MERDKINNKNREQIAPRILAWVFFVGNEKKRNEMKKNEAKQQEVHRLQESSLQTQVHSLLPWEAAGKDR